MISRILPAVFSTLLVLAQVSQVPTLSSEEQIRAARKEIDEAFRRHDAKRLTALFGVDCHFTAPTVHVDGALALERSHESLFSRRPDVILTHHINRVTVNENWDVAAEQGEWVERWTEKDGLTELRGTYLTMWKRESNRWLESSEMIVPETCHGSSYCR